MELTTLSSPASPTGETDDGPPASGGRRRIVPFVAKRAEGGRSAERPATKSKRPSKTPPPAAPMPSDASAQTLVPVPRRSAVAAAAAVAKAAPDKPIKKDAFILSFDNDVRASEIQAAGATKGLTITVGYVHWVRSRAKAAQSAQRAPKPARATPKARSASVVAAPRPKAAPAKPSVSASRLGTGGVDPKIATAITAAAIATARMPDRRASERAILEASLRWVGIERAIGLLRSAQHRVDLLLRP